MAHVRLCGDFVSGWSIGNVMLNLGVVRLFTCNFGAFTVGSNGCAMGMGNSAGDLFCQSWGLEAISPYNVELLPTNSVQDHPAQAFTVDVAVGWASVLPVSWQDVRTGAQIHGSIAAF